MTENETFTIRTCHDLNLGDEIAATYKGVTVHRGRVTDLAPDTPTTTSSGSWTTSAAADACWT